MGINRYRTDRPWTRQQYFICSIVEEIVSGQLELELDIVPLPPAPTNNSLLDTP
jgi:hypothetical protein